MEGERTSRRGFLSAATNLCVGIVGTALAVPAVLYLVFPLGRRVVKTPDDFLPIGRLDAFPLGEVKRAEIEAERRDAWTLSPPIPIGAVFVRRTAGGIDVFSTTCPHLSCDVEWRRDRFECPCHDSSYGPDGARRGGPAQRGLDTLEHRVQNGILEVKYQRFRPDTAEKVPV
jgi:Rieske Fe-S protein